MKTCSMCGQEKPLNSFYKKVDSRDGHQSRCMACDKASARESRIRLNSRTDGLYGILRSMKQRCYYPRHPAWRNYGGRGISICEEWLNDPEEFYKWAQRHGYRPGLEIDRVDCNGSYTPFNCRFVSSAENNRNRRNTKLNLSAVRQIRELLHRGTNHHEIATRFGVSRREIAFIRQGAHWKEVV
jgi:hypothetical protein